LSLMVGIRLPEVLVFTNTGWNGAPERVVLGELVIIVEGDLTVQKTKNSYQDVEVKTTSTACYQK